MTYRVYFSFLLTLLSVTPVLYGGGMQSCHKERPPSFELTALGPSGAYPGTVVKTALAPSAMQPAQQTDIPEMITLSDRTFRIHRMPQNHLSLLYALAAHQRSEVNNLFDALVSYLHDHWGNFFLQQSDCASHYENLKAGRRHAGHIEIAVLCEVLSCRIVVYSPSTDTIITNGSRFAPTHQIFLLSDGAHEFYRHYDLLLEEQQARH